MKNFKNQNKGFYTDLLITNSIALASELENSTKAELISMCVEHGLDTVEEEDIFTDLLLETVGIQRHTATNGSIYTTLSLPLLEIKNNGALFLFAYQAGKVAVTGDLAMYKAFKAGSVTIGDMFAFNYSDADSFKLLNPSAGIYVANNSQQNPSNGAINKTLSPVLMQSVLESSKRKDAIKLLVLDTADKTQMPIATIRKQLRELQSGNIVDLLKQGLKTI
jgi:hypothetical protein